jgi:transcriptional regulator with XRE-family HTH domain
MMTDQAKSPLKTVREKAGLTQAEVASLVGVHTQYISEIERGRRPGMAVAVSLRNAFSGELTLDDLVPSLCSASAPLREPERKAA